MIAARFKEGGVLQLANRNLSVCLLLLNDSDLEFSSEVVFLDIKRVCDFSAMHQLHILDPFTPHTITWKIIEKLMPYVLSIVLKYSRPKWFLFVLLFYNSQNFLHQPHKIYTLDKDGRYKNITLYKYSFKLLAQCQQFQGWKYAELHQLVLIL